MARMNDRGQILLIGAITIAVTFISMAIVLNGSLHTPSIAAEASDHVTGTELEEVRDTIRQEASGLIRTANTEFTAYRHQERVVQENLSTLGNETESYYARKDVALQVGPSGHPIAVINGSYVTNTLGDDPSDPTGEDYTAAFRKFEVDVSGSATATVHIDNGTTNHTLTIQYNSITVDGGSPCNFPPGNIVEVTNASAGDKPCANLDFVNNLEEPYKVVVKNTTSGSVTYNFIANDPSLSSNSRIYGVEVPIEYRSPSVTFVGNITVAPGEP